MLNKASIKQLDAARERAQWAKRDIKLRKEELKNIESTEEQEAKKRYFIQN